MINVGRALTLSSEGLLSQPRGNNWVLNNIHLCVPFLKESGVRLIKKGFKYVISYDGSIQMHIYNYLKNNVIIFFYCFKYFSNNQIDIKTYGNKSYMNSFHPKAISLTVELMCNIRYSNMSRSALVSGLERIFYRVKQVKVCVMGRKKYLCIFYGSFKLLLQR
ncbi:MAG: hypothetical protein CVV02_12640 [Firmicutes bacterium HGW-Firmicutes-7]|nr:MAG: hypothetical protein CVV02_12640 [Firmicutes bacterium HGW-Firmicutes-7]